MWALYDYCDPPRRGGEPPQNRIQEWMEGLQRPQWAKVNVRLDAIIVDPRNESGDVGPPQFVSESLGGLYIDLHKIKIQGGPSGANTRIIVCRGPVDPRREITLLYGARELGRNWVPADARDRALERLASLRADLRRRVPHEWVPRRRSS
jgi:hypothetical protein